MSEGLAADNRDLEGKYNTYFSTKTYVVGTH